VNCNRGDLNPCGHLAEAASTLFTFLAKANYLSVIIPINDHSNQCSLFSSGSATGAGASSQRQAGGFLSLAILILFPLYLIYEASPWISFSALSTNGTHL